MKWEIGTGIQDFEKLRTRPELNLDPTQMEFTVFCIENLATDLAMDPTDVYDLLTMKSDILYSYIIPCFDSLHTQDRDYILEDIKQVMREKGVLS